ncbi:MAG: hypothetical protein AB1634_08070, partial [Thermodesulfobacteriota bacterium]
WPAETLFGALWAGRPSLGHLSLPLVGLAGGVGLTALAFARWQLPRVARRYQRQPEGLVSLDTPYRQHLWERVRSRVQDLLAQAGLGDLAASHARHQARLDRFLAEDLRHFYEQIR